MFNATSVQFKFQQNVPSKWCVSRTAPSNTVTESDDHFNRHLETVANELDEEEMNSEPVDNLDDENHEDQPADDEPKVFQDEEVLDEEINDPILLKKSDTNKNSAVKATTSVMPTPLAYSRSSSFTSLNSFDVKSIHSTVDSEYSQIPKIPQIDSSQLDIDDDDLDNLMPDSPAAPDSSFLKAQRTIHKIKQAECRQNAWKISSDLNSIMSKLSVSNDQSKIIVDANTTPPIKLSAPIPKFLQSNHQAVSQPVMSVTYGFLKNTNPPIGNSQCAPKFLMSSNTTVLEDSPKVYSTVKPRQGSPQESVCSRMSDASLPSLIRQDTGLSKQKFNTVMTNNPSFKALFDKLNVPKSDSYSSSSSSGSSCSSVIPKLKDEIEDENESSFLNTTTKPTNTPAGFASAAGTSMIDEPDDQESKNGECLYIDFDLENFIKENFQPSFNEEEKKICKRASLQSLDVNLNKTKIKNTSINKKRLSEDNLKIPTSYLKKTDSKIPRSSVTTGVVSTSTAVKTSVKSQPPVVNMTRTAQLRASKMNQSKCAKVEKKVTLAPKINKVVKTTDRFNSTVNENSDSKSQTGSSRRFSIGHNSVPKKDALKKNPVLSNYNKDFNSTITCKTSVAKNSVKPVESAKNAASSRIVTSRVMTKPAK